MERFEAEFAESLGRSYGIAVASGSIGLMVSLRAMGIGPGDEVIASAYSWHQIAHAIVLVGATPIFADIDYWSGTLAVDKAEAKITPHTRAIIAGNTNGHPAAWEPLRALAEAHGIRLIEDSTEAIGSRYKGGLVGTFGDLSIFDFSQPSAWCAARARMIVTDDPDLASELYYHRSRRLDERFSISIGSRVPYQASISDMTAALGLAQLDRLDEILARRKRVEELLQRIHTVVRRHQAVLRCARGGRSALDGLRRSTSARALRAARATRSSTIWPPRKSKSRLTAIRCICSIFTARLGYKKGDLFVTEKVADRSLALPFHGASRRRHDPIYRHHRQGFIRQRRCRCGNLLHANQNRGIMTMQTTLPPHLTEWP